MIVNDNLQFNENIFKEIEKNKLNDKIALFYTLSVNHKEYLINTYPKIKNKIVSIHHPFDIKTEEINTFNIDSFLHNKKIYNIGWWLRNFKTFIDFVPPNNFQKIILIKNDFKLSFDKNIYPNNNLSTVEIVNEIDDDKYMEIFKNSCVFADIVDCIANNTILECIKFNTPIILRRSKSAEEYLGTQYPLFFTDINELELFTEETFLLDLIVQAHTYLKNMNKQHISLDIFNSKMQYDINKFAITNEEHKLTWVWFMDTENITVIEHIIKNFLEQQNNNKLKLLIFINNNSNLLETLNMYNNKNENIAIIKLNNNYCNMSLNKRLHFVSEYVDTSLITFINSNLWMDTKFSTTMIQYMEETPNCDISLSSFTTIYKNNKNKNNKTQNIFPKGEFLFQKHIVEYNLENICLVLRKNIFQVLPEYNLVDNNQTNTFLISCLENNLNIRSCSQKILFSILN